jgi:hypothetical protein
MTAPDKIWLQFSFDMLDKHDDHPFPHSEPYHHQRTVDELLEAFADATVHMKAASAALRADGMDDLWLNDFDSATERARALIAKHRKGG